MSAKKFFIVTLALLFSMLTICPIAHAQNDLKIGVVDVTRCMNESRRGKAFKEELRLKAEEIDKKLSELKSEAQVIAEQAERLQSLQSDEQKAENMRRFQALQEQAVVLQKEKRALSEQQTQKALKALEKVFKQVAEENGFDFILTNGTLWLPYFNEKFDLTDKMIVVFDGEAGE